MALLFKQGAASELSLQDFEPTFGQKFGAVIDETLLENPTTVGYRNLQLAFENSPKLSADEAKSFLEQYPFQMDLKPTDGQYSEEQLRTLAERQRELRMVQDIRDRTPWDYGSPIRALGMFGASLVDPINVATAFIPWTKTITAARALEAARLSSSAGTRFLGRAGLGAIDGGISTAAIEPFYALGRTNIGDDYDALDSIANIAFGTVIGGGILGIGGVGTDAFRKLARREIPSDRFAGLSVDDIQLVLALDVELKAGGMMPSTLRAVLESYSPEMRRAAGFDAELPPIRTREISSAATVVARADDGLSMTVKNLMGAVQAQMDGTNLRVMSARIADAENGAALLERTANEGIDGGMSVVSDATVPTQLARTIEALEQKGFVVTRNPNAVGIELVTRNRNAVDIEPSEAFPDGAVRSVDGEPVYRVERGEGYQRPEQTAQDMVDIMSPETREATFRAGVAQMLSGYNLSIDPIIKTDAAFPDTVTAADLKKNADLSLRPENIRAADFEASEEIQFDNDNSQSWDNAADAELAMLDADTQLEQTIAAGDNAYKYARAKATANKPGAGVEPGNKLGFEPDLRVKANIAGMTLPKKALILQKTNIGNAQSQIDAIDEILGMFPNASKSVEEWARMQAYAFASEEVPVPPYAFIRDVNSDLASAKLSRLSAGQIADANEGFAGARDFRQAYTNNELSVETTGKLFLWSFLSRGVSPYTQEGLFIDSFGGINKWIDRAAAGTWDVNATEVYEIGDAAAREQIADFIFVNETAAYEAAKVKAAKLGLPLKEEVPERMVFNVNPDDSVNMTYEQWARLVSPKGSGQPGSGAIHNLNAFGKLFLAKMSQRDENGVSLLQKMHDMMSDPDMTGKEIRRWFIGNTSGVGIDNKVVSFTLLVTGFEDVMVLDRVQIRQLWDDGKFAGKNLYDGRKVNGKKVAGSSLADITLGARGLLMYEAIERALSERIVDIYSAVGRSEDASIGRYHWETWVADSQQEASHGTLGAILPDARGDDNAIARVTVKQGEYGAYEYGARYGRTTDGEPYFVYNTPDGQEFEFNIPAFREFLTEISRKGKGRVVPSDFKVTESGNAPWYTRPEVDQQLLTEIAKKWADRDGGTGKGAKLVQKALEGKDLPNGGGPRYSRGSVTVEPIPNDIGPIGFYSALSRNITSLDTKAATPAGWKQAITGMIKKGAVKEAEVEWTGLNDWLDLQDGRVTKEQVNEFLQNNGVQVEEVTLLSPRDIENKFNDFLEGSGYTVEIFDGQRYFYNADGDGVPFTELPQQFRDIANQVGTTLQTKYGNYTLPGGSNYRELLLRLPRQINTEGYTITGSGNQWYLRGPDNEIIEAFGTEEEVRSVIGNRAANGDTSIFQSSHFEQPNIVSHIRVNDRVDADGAKVLFVEELQSDWAQEGRKRGFKLTPEQIEQNQQQLNQLAKQILALRGQGITDQADPRFLELQNLTQQRRQLQSLQTEARTPIAPFVTDTKGWLSLSLKRILYYAAENEYDKVAFISGKQSADRYSLSKAVETIKVVAFETIDRQISIKTKQGDGFSISVDNNGVVTEGTVSGQQFIGKSLDEIVGKDMAQQIMGVKENAAFSGLELDVGGEGMISFYDKIVPNNVKDLLKKFGGDQVETVTFEGTSMLTNEAVLMLSRLGEKAEDFKQVGFSVTAPMRQRLAAGVPMFARGGYLGTVENANEMLTASFGRDTQTLIDAGQLQIVNKVADLPGGPHPADVKAMTAPDGRVFVVAENVSPAEMRGIVLHEVGVHVGMERMLGADVFQSVLKDLDAATMRGEAWAQAARDSVPEDTPRSLIREEQLAYLVQNAPETPLAQRIIAAIRAWAFRTFEFARDRLELTEADYRSLAISGLKFAARQQRQQIGSLGNVYARGAVEDTSTVKSELTAADANMARVKSFAGVLRAAAEKLDNDAQAVEAMRSKMPDLTAQEIDELLVGLRTQVKNLRGMTRKAREALVAGDKAAALQPEAMQAADMLANNLQLAAVIERRNAALNLNARLKATSFVNQFREKELDFEGFAALLVGSERVRIGARISVDAEAKAFRGEFNGGLLADMEKAGLNQAFISGRFDRDLYDAMWRMGSDTPDMTGLSPEVIKMAEIINKYQNAARNRRNRFGAWIRDLQGYITRQTHDMFKIRAVTQDEWVNVVKDKIDLPKMIRLGIIDETDPIGSLRSMYNDFASGSHIKPMAAEEDIVALGRGSNLAKRESVSRTLYFKDGLAAYDYHAQFGGQRLAEEVLTGLNRSATSAALLKTLGTNPEATLTRLLDEYEESLKTNPARLDKFRSQRGAIMNLLAQVDGTVFMPGNVTAAKVNSFLRSWTSMAKLGGALISSVSDLAGYAAELRYAQNKNMYSGLADSVGALLKGRAKGDRADILGSLGVFYESVSSGVSARFDSPELVSGKMAAGMQTFFRMNGLTWWTEVLRDGAALAHSNYMAMQSSKAFRDINPELRRLLTLYNIDAGKWDLMRMGKMQSADGKMYLTPESLRTLPQESLESYIRSVGRTVSPAAVQNLIDDLSQTMRIMFIDRAHHAVLEPNARNRAFMLRGTKPGTVPGEILRYIGQFKSFSVAITQSVLGREVYGRGYDTVGEYLRKGRGDMLGLAHMIGLYGLLGYGAMTIKDLIKGREPRNPLSVQTVIAALAQGGGLGLYGDFLFGEYSRFGKSLVSSIAGPVAGAADTVAELYTRVRNGDDVAAVSFKALLDNTPFANLFWLRPLLDYAILFNIQESLNPGYLRRMERRVERQNEQQFLFKPSEVIR